MSGSVRTAHVQQKCDEEAAANARREFPSCHQYVQRAAECELIGWAAAECGIEDDQLAAMGDGALNTKSIIKKSIMAAVDKSVPSHLLQYLMSYSQLLLSRHRETRLQPVQAGSSNIHCQVGGWCRFD